MAKRLIALMMVLVAFLSTFYGCGRKKEKEEEVSTSRTTEEEVSIIPRTTACTTETTFPQIARETITLQETVNENQNGTKGKIVLVDLTDNNFRKSAKSCFDLLKKEGKISPNDRLYVVGGELKGAEVIDGFTVINALTTILKKVVSQGRDFIIISNMDFNSSYWLPYDVTFEESSDVFVYAKEVDKERLEHIRSKMSGGQLTLVEIA